MDIFDLEPGHWYILDDGENGEIMFEFVHIDPVSDPPIEGYYRGSIFGRVGFSAEADEIIRPATKEEIEDAIKKENRHAHG